MNAAESAAFLASRPPTEPVEAKAHVLDDATAAKLRASAKASSPDGKPARKSRFPWRMDRKWVEMLANSTAKLMKQTLDSHLAPIRKAISDNAKSQQAKIEELERRLSELAQLKEALDSVKTARTFSEFDSGGNLLSTTVERYVGGES